MNVEPGAASGAGRLVKGLRESAEANITDTNIHGGIVRYGALAGAVLAAAAAVPAGTALAAGAPAPLTCATVSIGAQGAAVRVIQRTVGAVPDGIFGPHTRASIAAFQRAHHVPATGKVDAATWAALPRPVALAACSAPVSGTGVSAYCPAPSFGHSGLLVAVAQNAVHVSTDGLFGPITEGAVRHAQSAHHLRVTGVVDPHTWQALHLLGSPACTSMPRTPAPGGATTTKTGTKTGTGTKPSSDAAAQAAIHAEVLKMVAGLAADPGTPADVNSARALAFALSQRGKPYQWGGTGPASYDCSGLVLASYRAAGIELSRTAAEQYDSGAPVPLNRVQPGDIVFYASDLTRPATIYHDAIYLGHGLLVNAPFTGQKVRVEPLFTTDLLPTAERPSALLQLPVDLGDTGWSVRQLQADLDALGANLTVDGGDGPLTTAAVKRFQADAHLYTTGSVGPATWAVLANALRVHFS